MAETEQAICRDVALEYDCSPAGSNHIDGLRRAARHARRERLPALSRGVTVGATWGAAQQRGTTGHAGVRTTTLTSPGLLDRIAGALDVALSGRGFPPGQRADAGDALIRRWVRDCTWKRDVVDVVYRRGRTQLSINVSVDVPAAGHHITIDGTNVGYLVGRPDGYPLPRGWFRTWKLRRFLNRIDRDTRAALDWFDEYRQPAPRAGKAAVTRTQRLRSRHRSTPCDRGLPGKRPRRVSVTPRPDRGIRPACSLRLWARGGAPRPGAARDRTTPLRPGVGHGPRSRALRLGARAGCECSSRPRFRSRARSRRSES